MSLALNNWAQNASYVQDLHCLLHAQPFLTLEMPRKPAPENAVCLCHLLNILANFSNPFLSHLLVAGCDIGVRFSVRPSVRLSTFMSKFDIYVKVSILINYKTKQPSNLAGNISLTSWLCNIGIRISLRLSVRPSVCQHLCWSSTFMSKLVY